MFESKEPKTRKTNSSENFQLPVINMDESSLPEPSPRAPDWFQSSPSIGWTLELDDHVKSVTMTSYPDHFNPSVSAKLRADGEILLVNFGFLPMLFHTGANIR